MVMLLAKTGITKAGYLLKQHSSSQWRSLFFVLNDHCLGFCSEKHNFERLERSLLLTAATRVYQQDDESDSTVIRIETGCEVILLRAKDETETKEWQRAIHTNVGRLSELARGQFKVRQSNGRCKDRFIMLHRECITIHPSFSETAKVLKILQVTNNTSFTVKGENIELKTGATGDETLSMTATNEIEHKHLCYALDTAISRLQKGASKAIVPPPTQPIHSSSLLCLDTSNMKWKRKHVVLTEECLYMHGHRRLGFDTPQKYELTPNVMLFSTTLKEHSFELVLFSDSIHFSAPSDSQRAEWIFVLQQLIPKSSYVASDPLQEASLVKEVKVADIQFHSECSPGILLERRGNWAIAALVSESLSRVCQGSLLMKVEGESVMMQGFDSIVTKLGYWRAPLSLSFILSPQKMGWLTLMVKERSRSWLDMISPNQRASNVAAWVTEKVYTTLSSGVLTLYTIKRDGKSKKRAFGLYGSAVGLVASSSVNGYKHCFKVLDGMESIILQAQSNDDLMEWSTSLATTISMENGGGLLLDREKRALERDGCTLRDENNVPTQETHDIRSVKDDAAKSVVFAKPLTEKRANLLPEKKPISLEPIAEIKSNKLDTSHVTEVTGNTTFSSLDPVDLSRSMEDFARNFFVSKDNMAAPNRNMPVQALRTEASQHWLTIDRVSSTSSASDIFDKASDFDHNEHAHMNEEDFDKLLEFTNSLTAKESEVVGVQ